MSITKKWEKRGLTIWEPEKEALSIAVVTQHHKDAKENACLIAAAPELLAALEAVMFEWREGYGLNCKDQVCAAIAKAKGETS